MGKFARMNQYKTALHAHTTNSDGANSLNSVIEEHYKKDYDILAITDHDYFTANWVVARRGITQERFDEIAAGVGRNGKGMLQIPHTIEQSHHEHVNTYFAEYSPHSLFSRAQQEDPHFVSHGHMVMEYPGIPEQYTIDELRVTLQMIQSIGGISQINHPGRYTGAGHPPYPVGPSNDVTNITKYKDLFSEFHTCRGMSIINKKDGESRNDRILWDNINAAGALPMGFSNDDTHNNADTGFSYNMTIMWDRTLSEFRSALYDRNVYAVAKVAHNEGVNSQDLNVPPPIIKDIEIGPPSPSPIIEIFAERYTQIDWITEGTVTIAHGNRVDISTLSGVDKFIRANVIGPGGIAFTQPFSVQSGLIYGW